MAVACWNTCVQVTGFFLVIIIDYHSLTLICEISIYINNRLSLLFLSITHKSVVGKSQHVIRRPETLIHVEPGNTALHVPAIGLSLHRYAHFPLGVQTYFYAFDCMLGFVFHCCFYLLAGAVFDAVFVLFKPRRTRSPRRRLWWFSK